MFYESSFNQVKFDRVEFYDDFSSGAIFQNCTFRNVSFFGSNLENAVFENCVFFNTHFKEDNLGTACNVNSHQFINCKGVFK